MYKKKIRKLVCDYWGWVVAVVFGIVVAGVVVVRVAGPLGYNPVTVEGLSATEMSKEEALTLADGRRIEQSFVAVGHAVSHVGLRILNLRGANFDAVISARLVDNTGTNVGSAQARLGDFRDDDVTLLPLLASLAPGERYTLEVVSDNVLSGQDASVFYEQDAQGFPKGDAVVIESSGKRRQLSGNIRFQIVAQPDVSVMLRWLFAEPAWWVVITYFGLLTVLFGLRKRLAGYSFLRVPCIKRRDLTVRELMVVSVLGLVLAFTVTLPYFTGIDKITTMGDVQRALVYRGVAREALLNEGDFATWDPYLCGGEPLLANMESAHTDPFFLLPLIFGENVGTRMSVTVTLALGFVGAYALARRYARAGKIPALLAGLVFSFSGFQMLAFANGNYAWIPIGWIPWFIWFALEASSASAKWRRNIFLSALFLAFIFLGGSLHMTLYAVLAALLLFVFLSLFYKTARPILVLLLIGMLCASLIAIKLWPVAEVEAVSGEFLRPEPFIQPWSWLPRMFWDRDQLSTPQWTYEKTGENFRWIEYGTYVGVVPTILFLAGLFAMRRNKMMVAVAGGSLFLLLMTFNEFPAIVLRELPFLQGVFRNPQRARSVFLLFFGMIAAYGLSRTIRGRYVQAAIVTLLLLDFATFHADLYPRLFNLEQLYIEQSDSFLRLHESYTDYEESGYYKVSYENYRANLGVVDMCMPYMMQRGIYARGKGNSNPATPYFGEAMLTEEGEIDKVVVNGDATQVTFTAKDDGWLVLNQNYFPGWQTQPAREVKQYKGLVAARVTPDDMRITFEYAPTSATTGFGVTALGLSIGVAGWWSEKRRT